MLDWDSAALPAGDARRQALLGSGATEPSFSSGQALYRELAVAHGPARASEILREAGVPGISYLDGLSRQAGQGTRNFVVFDPSNVNILSHEYVPQGMLKRSK